MIEYSIIGIVLVSALVTVILRILPFTAAFYFRENNYFTYLRHNMPLGITLLLVAYTFKDINFLEAPFGLPMITATLLLIACYVITRHAVISIFIGLGVHLLLVNSSLLDFMVLSG